MVSLCGVFQCFLWTLARLHHVEARVKGARFSSRVGEWHHSNSLVPGVQYHFK